MKTGLLKKVLYLSLPVFLPLFVYAIKTAALWLIDTVPSCPFYVNFNVYCPGCGNTRSVMALARGDILTSLRSNITIAFFALTVMAFYIEGAFWLFGKRVRLVPRSNVFLGVTVAFFLLYFLIRNFIPALAIPD